MSKLPTESSYMKIQSLIFLEKFLCEDWDLATESEMPDYFEARSDQKEIEILNLKNKKVDLFVSIYLTPFIEQSCYTFFCNKENFTLKIGFCQGEIVSVWGGSDIPKEYSDHIENAKLICS